MREFKSKEEVFDYVLSEFGVKPKTVLLRGSLVNERVKPFSSFEIEIYHRPDDELDEEDVMFYALLTRGMAFHATQDMDAVLDMGRESFGDNELVITQH